MKFGPIVAARILGLTTLFLASGVASAALTLNVELNPNPVRPSETLIAQLTVANNGGAPVTSVTLQATVPSNVNSFLAVQATGGPTCSIVINNGFCDPTEIVTWTIGTVPAGGGVTVSLPLTVASGATAGTVITLATNLLVNNVSTATANPSATVSTTNALSLSVDEDKHPVAPGDTLTYTLTYANRAASSNVTGTTLSFPVPAGTTFVSATGGGSFSAGSVQWTLGTLPATQSGHQQVVVSVNGGTANGAVLAVNTAGISGSSGVAESASATAVTRVAATPPLVVGVELNPDAARPNEPMLAEVTVSNRGGVALTGVTVLARVPQSVTSFLNAQVTGTSTCPYSVINNGFCDSGELVTWTIGTIPAGGGITLSLPMGVAAGAAAGRILNLEVLAIDDGNNRAVSGTAVAVDTDNPLSLSVDDDRNPVAGGATLTYTLTYGNRAASSSITGTTLSFPVPAGTTFVSATGGGTLSGSNVQWNLGSIPATQSGHQQVVVSVNGGTGNGSALAVNAATISGTNSSLISEAARATAITRVAATPPLVLGVELNPDPVRPQEQMIAELTVSNPGGAALTGVTLLARVPQSVNSFLAAQVTGPSPSCPYSVANNGFCDSGELVTWSIGTIPAGGGITLSLPMGVAAGAAAGRILNLEVLASDDGSNRAVSETAVAVDSDNPLSLSVQADRSPVAANNILTYTLAYANRAASSSITSTTLNFPIPAGTTFVSATGGGTLAGGNVQWALGSLAATQSDHQQVVVSVNPGTSNGSALAVNAATLSGNNSSLVAEAARATAITRVAATPPLVLGVELNPDPVRPGEQMTGELTVSNRGGVALTGVTLLARVPQSVNSFLAAQVTGPSPSCPYSVANNGFCDSGELVTWPIGTIPAGAGVTVSLPMIAAAGTAVGRLLDIEVLANDDGSNQAVSQSTVAADSNNPLSLAVNDNRDAVPGGGILQYTLTYGNRAASGSETGTVLSFPLPVETVLLGSTGGSVVNGNVVWNLGSIAAGTGGRKIVTLSVPGAVTAGSVIRVNAAQLRGNVVAGVVPDAVRTMAATRVEAAKPIGLTLAMAPDPVQATQTLTATLTVTNNSGGTLTGMTLLARVPQSVNSFNPTMLSGGGTCPYSVINNGFCDSGELATWSLGTMANGASTTVTMPMVVTAGTLNGRLIPMESLVTDDAGKLSTMERTVLLNPFTDGDTDGVANIYDNCTLVANNDAGTVPNSAAVPRAQLDADYDGYGNICDADINESGLTTVVDYTRLRNVLNQPYNFNADSAAADMNGSGMVTVVDYTLLRNRLNTAPGPSGLAP